MLNINQIKNKIYNLILKHPNLFVFLAYFFITIVITLPVLISSFNNQIPATGGDAFQILGVIKNFQKNFVINDSFNISEFFVTIIKPTTFLDLKTWLSVCDMIFKEPFSYTLLWFLSFPFAGLGCYMLTNYIVKNKLASFCAGLIFAFMPYHVAHSLGHFGATHIEFIPFAVLFLIKFLREQNVKNTILSILFTAIIFVNEPHYAIYLALFILLLFVYFLIFERQKIFNKKFIIISTILFILIIIFGVATFLPMIKVALSNNNTLDLGYWQTELFSADFGSFITPFFLHPIWGNFFQKGNVFISGTTIEASCFVGFSVLFFVILGIVYIKKEPNKLKYFFLFIGIFFSILAMGPTLHFFGHKLLVSHMPYFFVYKYLPFFNNIRAVPRIFVFAMLSFSIISAIGIKFFIFSTKKRKQKKYLVVAIISCIVLIEFAFTMPTESIKVSSFYQNLDKTSQYAILEIPNSTSYESASKSMYYNSFHNKTIFGNLNPARPTPSDFMIEKTLPVIKDLLYKIPASQNPEIKTITKENSNYFSNFVLNQNNIKYILINKKYLTDSSYKEIKSFIDKKILAKKVFNDEEILVYEIQKLTVKDSLLLYEQKDYTSIPQINTKKLKMDINNNSIFNLINYNASPENMKMNFNIGSDNAKYHILEIFLNNEYIARYEINPMSFQKQKLKIKDIPVGTNEIIFKIFDENNQLVEDKNSETLIYLSDIRYQEE